MSSSESDKQPTEAPKAGIQCPVDYSISGTRGCYTFDNVSKKYGIYSIHGKLISARSCERLYISLSGLDADGNVICSGGGTVADVTEGELEPWNGDLLECKKEPLRVSLKMSTCL